MHGIYKLLDYTRSGSRRNLTIMMNVEKLSELSQQKQSLMPIVSPPVDALLDNSEGQFPQPRFVPLNQPERQAIVPPVSSSIVAPQDKAEGQSSVPQASPPIVRLLDNPEKTVNNTACATYIFHSA